jgi:nucleoside-diphosphate-sugar epimerase
LKISILGAGPIPNKLAQTLRRNSTVELFTSQEITIDSVEVFEYETFTSRIIDSKVVVLAWRGLPRPESEKAEVLKYLVQNIASNSVIFNLSSVAVYGQNKGINYETTIPKPINSYGQSKLNLEIFLDTFAASKVCHLRISNVFGDSKFKDIVNKMLKAHSQNTTINLVEPQKQYRDYISIDFLILVLKSFIVSSNQLDTRNVFNISSGTSMNLSELREFIEVSLGSRIAFCTSEMTPDIIEVSRVSNMKVSQHLQVFSNNNLDELRDYVTRA